MAAVGARPYDVTMVTWGAVIWLSAVASVSLAFGSAGAAEPVVPGTVPVAPGEFLAGSSPAERERAYRLDEDAYGHSITRENGWYDGERSLQALSVAGFSIMRTPVTNSEYAQFLAETGRPVPAIDRDGWRAQGLVHPYDRVLRHIWDGGSYPPGRAAHPVVLVTWDDANAYSAWLSDRTGRRWRLPSEIEWEKAARGTDGRAFPWGDDWDPGRLNSHDRGPFDTVAVGSYPAGASPYGMVDAAGQVFEWTATPAGNGRFIVKGGSWDDKGCGVCRPAARHGRPRQLRHILVGFRLVRDD